MNQVSFPNLGISLEVNNTAFSVGGFDVKWYAVIIATGFLCALIFAVVRGKEFGVDFDHFFYPVFFGVIAAIVGARAYFVIFHFDLYRDNLMEIFNIRNGGLAIYGGIIGGLGIGALVCHLKKIPAVPMIDMACIGLLIGQGFGRWGNFMNVEAYGAATSPDYLFGMTSPKIVAEMAELTGHYDPNVLVHPCFLYESLWCFLGAVVLMIYLKHRRFDGEISLLYLVWYGTERAIVEGLRMDSLYIGQTGIRVSQLLSMILVPIALALLIFFYIRTAKKKKADPAYSALFRDSEASRRLLEETEAAAKAEKEKKAARKAAREQNHHSGEEKTGEAAENAEKTAENQEKEQK